jgi:hypothetical protein
LGLTSGTGFVGTTTRAKLNSLLTVAPAEQEEEEEEEEEVEGELNVALAADTPAAQLVPAGGAAAASNVPFTKLTFTGTGKVSKITVTRGGVSTDADLVGVKLLDGNTQIGTTQTFNAAHQAVFNLTTPWEVSGTGTLTIAGDYAVNTTGQVILSIQKATDIVADVTVGGTFPIVGNPATGSITNVGQLTVDNGTLQPVVGATVDVDATNFIFAQAKLTAGAVEDVYINAVTVSRGVAASFIDSDLTNITLYNDTAGTELGKVSALGTDSKATFTLATPLLIERGRFVEISVRADILGGSTRNVAFDINDGVAYTIMATGKSYGYGVALNLGTWNGVGVAVNINRGTLNISKGANCPATGNVTVGGTDIELGSFNFKVRGESVRVGRTVVSIDNTTGTGGGIQVDIGMVKLVDSAGNVVAGPVTPVGAGVTGIATFTTSLTLAPGNNELFVVANIASVGTANESYRVGFDAAIGGDPSTAITNVRGMTSNLVINPAPAANVLGNGMTARQGALTADMTATPVGGNVIVGGQSITLGNLKLDATASGEDIRVTSATLTHGGTAGTVGAIGWGATLSDIELWDGSTQVGLTMQPPAAGATVTFTLTTPYIVSKGTSKTLAVKANLIAGAATETHTWQVAAPGADVVATTTSGAPVAIAPAVGAISPAQILQVNGALRVTIDASPVASAQLVANTTDNEVVRYKFWAYDENIEVTRIWVWAGDNNNNGVMPGSAPADIGSVSVWLGSTKISGDVPVSAGAASLVGIPAGALVIPKNGTKVVTIKVSFNDKISVTSGTDYQFGIADSGLNDGVGVACTPANTTMDDGCWGTAADADTTYAITATGNDSGQVIGSIDDNQVGNGQIFGGNAMELFDGKLVVTLSSASPSGTQSAGANQEVLRLDLEAIGDDINVDGLRLLSSATQAFNGVADTANLESTDGTIVYATTQAGVADTFDTGNSVCFGNNASIKAAVGTGANCGAIGVAFGTALVISEGSTTSVSIRGDTTPNPAAVTNTTLQLSLNDGLHAPAAADVDITWNDVEGGTPDLVGTKVIPLYGNTLRY